MDAKSAAAERAVKLVRTGMTVGLGSGSTSSIAIRAIGRMVSQGLAIRAIATSIKTENLAREVGIPLAHPSDVGTIDVALDGADEVDTQGNLVKGGGGSLLREKLIAYASLRFHVMIDESKLVTQLGSRPLPVEIIRFADTITLNQIKALGCKPEIRMNGDRPFVSDNGHYIADCKFLDITEPAALDVRLKMIPGVVETGLFSSRIVSSIFIGQKNGDVREVVVNS